MSFWYKTFSQYPENHRDYWRVKLVLHCLLIATAVPFVLCLINLVAFNDYKLALFDFIVGSLSLAAYAWFRHSANIRLASQLLSVLITFMVSLFIYMSGGYANSIFWAAIVPPITFFLMGRLWGTLLTGCAFSVCIYTLYHQIGVPFPKTPGMGSLLNVVESSLIIILLFRFYEGTRSQAYKQLQQHNKLVSHLAETDHLTGLYNREKFDQELDQRCQTHNAQDATSLLLVDVDHFKKINDSYGHLRGDEVLKALANKLTSLVRTSDIVARWGGEEFAILLPNTDEGLALTLAERLRSEVSASDTAGLQISISIGLVTSSEVTQSAQLLQQADNALYRAKANGRNCVNVA